MEPQDLIGIVCRVCRTQPEDLKLNSRKEPLSTARALAAHFLYKSLKMKPVQISPLIGHPDSDRTWIYHYLRKGETLVEQRSPFQKELRKKAELICRELRKVA